MSVVKGIGLERVLIALLLSMIAYFGIGCGPVKDVNANLIPEVGPVLEKDAAQPANSPGPESETIQAEPEEINAPEIFEAQELEPEENVDPQSEERVKEPQELLDSALSACKTAEDAWAAGELDGALASLDVAYSLILAIDTSSSPEMMQEKEDLRYLIGQRIVAVHATNKATITNNSKSIPLIINKHVEREIASFQTREREFFISSYVRSGRYRPMIVASLRAQGLPEELSWLPLIESGYKTNALSRARALGLWQFISSTGYRYGLNRDRWVDERMDPDKSTNGAIRYLIDLHAMFGDWMSALAGYNCGEGRVMRAIKSQRVNYLDNFWDLYEMLPRETARYVPRFLATLIILEDPAKYGFDLPEPEAPVLSEVVEIRRSVRLKDLDTLYGVGVGTFKELNPELRYGATPDMPYKLKVPAGSEPTLVSEISSLPVWEVPADSFVTHAVGRGESLSTIASKYKTSVSSIMQANNLKNAHKIWPGQKLKIPGRAAGFQASSSGSHTHRVVSGDNLWDIAKKYNTHIEDLRKWNKLNGNLLTLGQVLFVKAPTEPVITASNLNTSSNRTYVVQSGDTLGSIAKKNSVSLIALLQVNNLKKGSRIFPKQKLILP